MNRTPKKKRKNNKQTHTHREKTLDPRTVKKNRGALPTHPKKRRISAPQRPALPAPPRRFRRNHCEARSQKLVPAVLRPLRPLRPLRSLLRRLVALAEDLVRGKHRGGGVTGLPTLPLLVLCRRFGLEEMKIRTWLTLEEKQQF